MTKKYQFRSLRLLKRSVGWTTKYPTPAGELLALVCGITALIVFSPLLLIEVLITYGRLLQDISRDRGGRR